MAAQRAESRSGGGRGLVSKHGPAVLGVAGPPAAALRRPARTRARGDVEEHAGDHPAHRDRRSGGAERVPVLRRRLRAAGVRQGRAGRADRGRPRFADLARPAVPEGRGERATGQLARPTDRGALPGAARHRLAAPRPRHRHRHGRRAVRRSPGATPGRTSTTRAASCVAPWASPRSAARPWTTKRTT